MSIPSIPNNLIARGLLAALLLVLASGGAGAQEDAETAPETRPRRKKKPPPIAMLLEVGQENNVRAGRVAPIRVTLINNENAVTGHLEVRTDRGHSTQTQVDLPRGAQKYYTLMVPLAPPADMSSTTSGEVILRAGGKIVDRQDLKPKFLPKEAALLVSAAATGEGTGLKFLENGQEFRVRHLSPGDLPREWPGYEPADVVAMNGRAWQELTPEQRRAFRVWVEQGGRAIVCGDLPTQWRDPDGQALAGVTPEDPASLRSLECVAAWAGMPYHARAGALLSVSGPTRPGVLEQTDEEGRPLIVVRKTLLGRVVWLGFDPFQETFRAWDGAPGFWRRAIEVARDSRGPSTMQSLEAIAEVGNAVAALPRLPAPPLGAIIAFGVVYAVIFGPVNIWMLRRLRRTVRSWLFTPSLAAGMTLVALLVGQSWGNARTVLSSVTVMEAASGSMTANEMSLIGLFSPTNRAFDLQTEDPWPRLEDLGGAGSDETSTMQERLALPDHQDDGAVQWDAVALQLYSTRKLRLQRPVDLGGPVEMQLQERRSSGGAAYAGTVRNGAYFALRNAYLCRRGRYCWIGDLPPGKQANVAAEGWSARLKGRAADAAPLGELQENRKFRESARVLWERARDVLIPGRADGDLWLVAECPDHRPALQVAALPYSNRANLLLARLPLDGGPRPSGR